jgi:hypothetical protein
VLLDSFKCKALLAAQVKTMKRIWIVAILCGISVCLFLRFHGLVGDRTPICKDLSPSETMTVDEFFSLAATRIDATYDKVEIECRYGYSDDTWAQLKQNPELTLELPVHRKAIYRADMIFFDADKKELDRETMSRHLHISHDFQADVTQYTETFTVSAQRPSRAVYASVLLPWFDMETKLIRLK